MSLKIVEPNVNYKTFPAQCFAVEAFCKCGGAFKYIKIDMKAEKYLHKCDSCETEILLDKIYPATGYKWNRTDEQKAVNNDK